jgi:cytochrome c oxidase subunit 4
MATDDKPETSSEERQQAAATIEAEKQAGHTESHSPPPTSLARPASDSPSSDPDEPEDNDAADAIDDSDRNESAATPPQVEAEHILGPAHSSDHSHGHLIPNAVDAHAGGHDHGLAHTTPVSLLFGILGALLVLTIATVAVTAVDLGSQGNLVVAMVIATIKAALVVTFFMHLLWDKKFNLILFLTSVLFVILFLSMTAADRGEYQHEVDAYRATQLSK